MEVIMSSPIQNCSGLENAGGDVSASLRSRHQERKKRKLLRRENNKNPDSKLEVAQQNVDVIPQSSIQDNANTDLGTTATFQLGKRKRRKNRKLLREDAENPESKLEVANVDMIPQSSIQDNSNTDLGTTSTVQLSKRQIRRNRKLLREDTENPESKLEVARHNVDVITQSSIQDSPNIDLGTTATIEMTKCQKRRNRKLLREDTQNPERKLEVAGQNVDIITQSSIQDNSNTDLGTTATVELSKRQIRRNRKLLREDTENPESKLVVARQNVDIITQSSIQDNPNTDLGTTATVQLSKRQMRRKKKLLREDAENPESKLEVVRQNVDIITQSSIQDNPNTDLGTTATVQPSKSQIRRNRKLLREDAENPESKLEVARQNVDMIPQSSIQYNPNADLGATATVELSKRQIRRNRKLLREDTENSESKLEVARENVDIITQSSIQDNPNTDLGTTATVQLSKRQIRRNRKLLREKTENPESKLEVPCRNVDVITQSESFATPDAEMVSKGEERTKVANGRMGSDMPKNVHIEGTIQKKKKKKSRKEKPTLGEILNPRQLEDMEVAIGEMDSGTTATDHIVSKKRKKQKLENKDPASGDILGTRGCVQDMALAKKGLSSTRALESTSGESVSCKTATPDAKIVSKGKEHTKVANGEMGSSETKNLNVNGTVLKRNEQKLENTRPNVGEIVNCQYLQNLEAGNYEAHSTSAAKKKRHKLKKKAAKGEISTTSENTEDSVIAKKDAGTNKVFEAMSTESKREDSMEIVNGEKCLRTTPLGADTMIKSVGCTKVVSSEMGSSGAMTIVETTGSRGTSLDMNTVSKREEHTCSSGTTITKTVSKVEECTEVGNIETDSSISRKTEKLRKKKEGVGLKAIDVIPQVPTSRKKLIILDVNGLLADICFSPPKDVRADMYMLRRAIFKRPFLDDFLYFCFARFHVGIWSSRTMKVLDPVVDYLLGDLKYKLLFLWDGSSCTNSGMRTLEEKHKNIVFKDLRMIWERNGPGNSWVKGTFNESNTLLLDDSPYKALLNPKHSGIFPVSFTYKDKNDNFLGPRGALRNYLHGVAATDNLKMYVEQHPFGQSYIDEKNPHWSFYSRVLMSGNY